MDERLQVFALAWQGSGLGSQRGEERKLAVKIKMKIKRKMRTNVPLAAATIPYIKGLSEAVRRILQKYNVRTAFKTTNTLGRTLTNVKDPTPCTQRETHLSVVSKCYAIMDPNGHRQWTRPSPASIPWKTRAHTPHTHCTIYRSPLVAAARCVPSALLTTFTSPRYAHEQKAQGIMHWVGTVDMRGYKG